LKTALRSLSKETRAVFVFSMLKHNYWTRTMAL